MQEIWKDIYFVDKGITYDYRGYYQVSNLGRVKSLTRNLQYEDGRSFTRTGKILTGQKHKNGYMYVLLSKNGKSKIFLLHRIVALMFIKNSENKPEVNHDNGKKEECCVSNLYWATRSENQKHAYDTGLQNNDNRKMRINQYDLQGNFIKEWDCISSIEKALKINNSHICSCCKGKRKTAGGYVWKYVERR